MGAGSTKVINGIKTIDFHGKPYVEVSERLRIVHEKTKEFQVIESQPIQFADRCIWRVVITVEGKQYVGNAEAKMNAAKNSPDGTNPFECAETSALGRALVFAGIGNLESIASYDEVARGKPYETQSTQGTSVPSQKQSPTISQAAFKSLYERGKEQALFANPAEFADYVREALGLDAPIEFRSRMLTEDEEKAIHDSYRMRALQSAQARAKVAVAAQAS